MKFGLIFSLFAFFLTTMGVAYGGWYLLMLWPALSFALVATGYLKFGPRIFGKRPDGTLTLFPAMLLFPFLAITYVSWRLLRLFKKESPYQELTPQILIGRRLLSREFPADVHTVLDLTSEFVEPSNLRLAPRYISFPILDGAAAEATELIALLRGLGSLKQKIYIHCAEGHGRTGMVAAAVLLLHKEATSAEEAIDLVCAKRPGVRLKPAQDAVVREVARILDETSTVYLAKP